MTARSKPLLLVAGVGAFLCTLRCQAEELREISGKEARPFVVSAPRPEYSFIARQARYTGSGVFILNVKRSTGLVQSITIERSTGHAILDASAMQAFIRWRFKPNTVSKVRMPITYAMTGAAY